MRMEILSTCIKAIDKAISENLTDDEYYIIAEFMCLILSLQFKRNEFIFELIKAEYVKQSKLIDKFIIKSKEMDELDLIRLFISNKRVFSPFVFGYVERNI